MGFEVLGSGFEVLGLGSQVLGLVSGVWGLVSEVWGLVSEVMELVSRVVELVSEVLGLGFKVLGLGPRKDARHAAEDVRGLCSSYPEVDGISVHYRFPGRGQRDTPVADVRGIVEYPEVGTNCSHLKFPGRGQRDTPVVDVRGIVEIVMLLPGRHAARVRRQAVELLCRYLGGDLALVDKVYRNRGFQEQLAVRNDPKGIPK